MSVLPIGLRCDGLRVVVVGGGPVAHRKAVAFLECGARVTVVAPEVTAELRSANSDRLEIVPREFASGDVTDADVVIAATDDPHVNAAVARAARDAGSLVNRADSPESGDFDTLAVHRAGDLAIGVSAGGVPRAAARIRDAIAARFDDRYAHALDVLAQRRKTVRADAGTDAWRDVSNQLVTDDFCERVEAGHFAAESKWR